MYVSYKDKIQFFLIYITEAHPELLEKNSVEGITGDPENIGQRAILASKCVSELKLSLPILLDSMEGITEKACKGRPNRICIVDIDGKVAYYGARGPRGFKPEEAEEALKKILAREKLNISD